MEKQTVKPNHVSKHTSIGIKFVISIIVLLLFVSVSAAVSFIVLETISNENNAKYIFTSAAKSKLNASIMEQVYEYASYVCTINQSFTVPVNDVNITIGCNEFSDKEELIDLILLKSFEASYNQKDKVNINEITKDPELMLSAAFNQLVQRLVIYCIMCAMLLTILLFIIAKSNAISILAWLALVQAAGLIASVAIIKNAGAYSQLLSILNPLLIKMAIVSFIICLFFLAMFFIVKSKKRSKQE